MRGGQEEKSIDGVEGAEDKAGKVEGVLAQHCGHEDGPDQGLEACGEEDEKRGHPCGVFGGEGFVKEDGLEEDGQAKESARGPVDKFYEFFGVKGEGPKFSLAERPLVATASTGATQAHHGPPEDNGDAEDKVEEGESEQRVP